MDKTAISDSSAIAQLLRDQKRLVRITMVLCGGVLGILLAVTIALLILVPRAKTALDHAEASLQSIDALVAEADQVLTENTDAITEAVTKINAVDFEGLNRGIDNLVTDADTLLTENTDTVNEAVRKINNIDFDRLNQAIRDLSDVVEPLARFVNRFN